MLLIRIWKKENLKILILHSTLHNILSINIIILNGISKGIQYYVPVKWYHLKKIESKK